ncbi:MAG: immune inhibitor A, partial [Methanoregula sp.]|nr:immune inhibitor A [Methanoregula sp.]
MSKKHLLILSFLVICCAMLVMPVSADTIEYSQGFEANDGGYTHTGTLDQWEWGAPVFGPGSAHTGVNVWGTNLDGDVPLNSDSYLTSPAIAIPTLTGNQIARVRFWGWIAVDEMLDRGEFQVSSDGVNWETKSELFHTMQGTWTEYWFDVSNYAGGNIYLRFKLHADGGDAFEQSAYNMAGLYVDDVAIIIADKPASPMTLTLEAYEDQTSWASCPWIYSWNGAVFVKDNDVYSTARGKTKEFIDYYTLNGPVVPENGQYVLKLQETDQETSFTDLAQLIAVDHPAQVKIASDEKGNIWTYGNPGLPATATDKNGVDVRSQISTENDAGLKVFNNDFVELDFSNLDTSNGATLVLRVLGFQTDGPAGNPTYTDPSISIQTQDSSGQWVTRNTFNPRMDWATNAYNLKGYLTVNNKVRLVAASCHENKYYI